MTTLSVASAGETDDRLITIFDTVPVAMGITTLADGRVIAVNTSFLEMFGYRRDEIIGRRTSELNIWANLGERPAIVQQLAAVGTLRNLEMSFRARTGELRQALVSLQLITWGGESCMLSVALDTTEQKRAEAEQRLLQTITLDIARAADLESALNLVLQRICEVGDWRLGEAWLFAEDKTVLVRGPVWHSDDDALAAFATASADVAFAPGLGLPGVAWQSAAPVWKLDVTQDENFARRALAERAGLKTALAVPVLADDQVMTVIALFSREERPRNARQIELVAAVAAQLGEVLRRKQAEAAQAQRLHEVTALVDLSAALQLELSTDEMTATLARHAETALGADSVVVLVRDVTDDLVVKQGRGQAESLVGHRFALEEMPSFCSLHVGGICSGQPGCPLLPFVDPQVQVACIPMTDGARIIGTLQVGVRRSTVLKGDDLRLLGGIANLASNALRRISLFEQVRLYRDMFVSASDAMVITDMRTIVLDVNPAFETLTGYTRA
ncbi:MAG: PAS domain S-box protein, partial [Anaerolineae bacterium]